jgi:hypothetical protein
MSTNIVPFESKLPAFLRTADAASVNSDLIAHASTGGFPVISIKGKVFAVVRDGEREVLPNPKDPDSPATSIDVVMVKVNKGTSKVFYAKGYDEKNSEGAKPDCFSNEGVRPDAAVENPQSKSCATCKHNAWGSKIGDNGKKGKACQDSVRMAVSTVDAIAEPYLLRVPPASIKSLGEYGQTLAKRGVGYNTVLTKIGFDMESPTPKLTFKPVGYLDEGAYNAAKEAAESDVVRNILGGAPQEAEAAVEAPAPAPAVAAKPSKSKTVTEEEVETAVEAPAPAKKATKPAAVPVATADEDDIDLDLDGLSFDD